MERHKVFVGCCMVILNPSEDRVLVARRKKEPDLGGLQIPGGTVDYSTGENLKQAVVREVEEETGLRIADPKFLCMMNSFCYGPDKPLHIAFVGKSETEIVPINPEPHKAGDWEWLPLDAVSNDTWFRMSKVAVDFYNRLSKNPDTERFVIDDEYASAQ